MKNLRTAKNLIGSLIVAACFVACGGGSGEETVNSMVPPAASSYMLSWDVPESTVNNETINPYDDLYHYELYVSTTGSFSEKDTPVAFVSAVEDGLTEDGGFSKKLVTEFDLALLNLDGLSSSDLYVSLRVVGVDGQKSDFMAPVTWTRS